MEKISSSTRYADNIGNLHIEADVQRDERTGKITAINNGTVKDTDTDTGGWFNVSGEGKLSIGGFDATDKEALNAVTDAVISFYKEVDEA